MTKAGKRRFRESPHSAKLGLVPLFLRAARDSPASFGRGDGIDALATGNHRTHWFGDPGRHYSPGFRQFFKVFYGEYVSNCLENPIGFLRPQPCQSSNNVTRFAVGRDQLPSRRMAQVYCQFTQLEPPVGTRGQVNRFHGQLGRESQGVCRRAATGDYRFSQQRGQGPYHLFYRWGTSAEAGLDGRYVHSLKDAQQPAAPSQPRQSLIYPRASAQVK